MLLELWVIIVDFLFELIAVFPVFNIFALGHLIPAPKLLIGTLLELAGIILLDITLLIVALI